MNVFAFSGLIIGFSSLGLGIFTLLKSNKLVHYLWFLSCLSVAIWGFGSFAIAMSINGKLSLLFWKLSYIGVIFVSAFYTNFLIVFLNRKEKWALYIIYPITLLFIYLDLFSTYFIKDIAFVFQQFYYISSPTKLYNFFVAYFFVLVIYDLFILLAEKNQLDVSKKNQIKFFIFATLLSFGGGIFAFLPVYNIFVYPALNILVSAFTFIVVYAIFKHRLLDINIVIQRGGIYSLVITIIVGIYLVVVLFVSYFIAIPKEMNIFVSGALVTIFGIYTAPILEKFFRQKTDKLFFKDKYIYSQAVFEFSETLNNNLDLIPLLRQAIIKINKFFKPNNVCIFVKKENIVIDKEGKIKKIDGDYDLALINKFEETQPKISHIDEIKIRLNQLENKSRKKELEKFILVSDKYKINIWAPVFFKGKILGEICLGSKLSGDIYSNEDYNLLQVFSYQTGLALERARLYTEVKNYSQGLEQKVKERTSKLKGLQEEQKQMMLEIAHGLQTPLTIIKGELSLMKDDFKDKEKIKSLEHSIDRISGFIYKMLRLANYELRVKENKKEKLNLSALIEDAIENFGIICEDKGISLKSSIASDVFIDASASEIEELLTNLVSNSVKYIGDGRKIIKINLIQKNNKANLVVTDTGVGIRKKDLSKLFTRFYRANDSAHNAKKGTGLGLAICKKIAENNKAKIMVESEEEKGTRFVVVFPLV